MQCLTKAANLNDAAADVWLLLGDALSLKGQMRPALNCYARLDPDQPKARAPPKDAKMCA